MARSKEGSEKMREATREKILIAAIALFAEKGLAGTSAKDIARVAGVSVGLMYHHYKTKEDMFKAIVDDALKEVGELQERWSKQSFECGIKAYAEEFIAEMKKGLEFSQWMAILAQSTDFDRQLISEFAKLISVEKAQFFVATMQGLCQMQLTLKDEFFAPSVELMTSFLRGGEPMSLR